MGLCNMCRYESDCRPDKTDDNCYFDFISRRKQSRRTEIWSEMSYYRYSESSLSYTGLSEIEIESWMDMRWK